jgi:ABC-type xylose transport system permease subunit
MSRSSAAAAQIEGRASSAPSRASLGTLLSQGRFRLIPMIAVLIVVWIALEILTGGLFLSARNLTNLSGQVAITAVLAAGAVLLMVPGYIDLSLGATVAASAVVAAFASTVYGLAFWPTVLLTIGFGLVLGFWHAYWIAWMNVPSFIVTLASLLAIRGLSLVITNAETISPSMDMLVISDDSLPPAASIVLLFAMWAIFSLLQWREYRAQASAGVGPSFNILVLLPVASVGIVSLLAMVIAVNYRGIPLPVVIVLAVVAIAGGVLRYMPFGRRLYAIGGNRQAALLAGIDIRRHITLVFAAMGALYGLAGLMLVARLSSAPPTAGQGLELNVIAAAVIGGTSLMGGRGTVAGAVIGALLMESLANGMSLMNLPSSYQSIAVGLVLLFAVYVDVRGRGGRDE